MSSCIVAILLCLYALGLQIHEPMGGTISKHNMYILETSVQGDIIKVPDVSGNRYYVVSADPAKLYPLDEETGDFFCYPEKPDQPRQTVSFPEACGGLKCDRISVEKWITETVGGNVSVEIYNIKFLQALLPGDTVKVSCHNVLYIGSGEIIHLLSTSGSCCNRLTEKHRKELKDFPDANGLITQDKLIDLGKNKKFYKNNRRDYVPLSINKIIKRAKAQLGPAKFYYYTQNCLHFVEQTKYGLQLYRKIIKFSLCQGSSILADTEAEEEPFINKQCRSSRQVDFQDIELQNVTS